MINILRTFVILLSFVSVLCDQYGVYPSSYPFEDDTLIPIPELTDATPTFDFAHPETDPGGYIHIIYTPRGSFNSYPGPLFMPTMTGFVDYNCFLVFGIPCSPAFMPISVWNCTSLNFPVQQSWFEGTFNGVKICEASNCCKETIGQYSIFDLSSLQFFFTGMESHSTSGYCCPTAVNEAMYCAMALTPGWCMERYIDRLQRTVILPCPDNFVYYFVISCPAFRSNGVWGYVELWETPLYRSKGTTMDSFQILIVDMLSTFDFVCYPYSYYYPVLDSDKYVCGGFLPLSVLMVAAFLLATIL